MPSLEPLRGDPDESVRRQARQAALEAEGAQNTQMTMGFRAMDHSEQLAFLGKEMGELLQMLRELKVPGVQGEPAGAAKGKAEKSLKKGEGTA